MILRRIVVRKQHSAPFDVEDTIRSAPETEVKIPQFPPGKLAQPLKPISVRWSSQTLKMVKSYGPTDWAAGADKL